MHQAIPKTLFIGWGVSVVSYYRAFLPAVALGADYVAWIGDDKASKFHLITGLGARPPKREELFDYDVIVLQQPRGVEWLKFIRELQDAGVTVLYEIDDYVQSARKIKSHELTDIFDAEFVGQMEMAMRVTDGIVCSTDYLARRYRRFNDRTWACYNGIDLNRYAYPTPEREGVTIGWAGGVGHKASLARWEPARARGPAQAPRGPLHVGGLRRRGRLHRGVRHQARDRPSLRQDRGLPGVDEAVRRGHRAVVGEQPVQGQERPALARGLARSASRSSPTPRPIRGSRTASPACTPARRRRSRRR